MPGHEPIGTVYGKSGWLSSFHRWSFGGWVVDWESTDRLMVKGESAMNGLCGIVILEMALGQWIQMLWTICNSLFSGYGQPASLHIWYDLTVV